jgi:BT1 family
VIGLSDKLFVLGNSVTINALARIALMPVFVLSARICPEVCTAQVANPSTRERIPVWLVVRSTACHCTHRMPHVMSLARVLHLCLSYTPAGGGGHPVRDVRGSLSGWQCVPSRVTAPIACRMSCRSLAFFTCAFRTPLQAHEHRQCVHGGVGQPGVRPHGGVWHHRHKLHAPAGPGAAVRAVQVTRRSRK